MRFYLALICIAFLPTSSFGACASNLTTLLSCPIGAGAKTLDVCAYAEHVVYRFVETGHAADLELIRDTEVLEYTPWAGVGSSIFDSLTFTSAGYSYEVFASKDRAADAPDVTGGVIVTQGAQPITDLHCDAGQTDANIDALLALREAAGLCYDYASFSWGACR